MFKIFNPEVYYGVAKVTIYFLKSNDYCKKMECLGNAKTLMLKAQQINLII